MADRGDVLRLKRKLGFGASDEAELLVVVQSSALNAALPTTVLVPLESGHTGVPATLSVAVSAAEAGIGDDCVALPTHLRVMVQDRLAPGRVGRLKDRTLAELENKIKLVLDL